MISRCTIAATLALADQHDCGMLKDACVEFISCSNVMKAVAATEGYKNLQSSCPSVVVEPPENINKTHTG
jgi:speckle-type POZ protein